MCELPDAVSNVVYFAIASWKWVSTLYIVQIFSKAFLLLNEVWFLFPESSHTLSPKPWYLSLVLCVRSFMTLMTFRERTVWTAYLRIALEEGQRQSPALKENAPCHPHPYIFTENKPVRETGEKGFQVHKMRGSLGARGLSVSGWGWAGPALSANSKALPVRSTRLSSSLFSQGNHDTTTAIIIVYFLGTKSSLYIISVNPSTLSRGYSRFQDRKMEVAWDSVNHQGHTGLWDSGIWRNLWNSLCVPLFTPSNWGGERRGRWQWWAGLGSTTQTNDREEQTEGVCLLSVEETLSPQREAEGRFPL